MKKESSTNLQKYSGIAEQMVKMSSDCPEITNLTLIQIKKNIIYLKQKSISRDGQKVIIDNSRGLRLGFLLSLPNILFFLFLNCYVYIKTRNKIFYICTETRNSNESHPGIYFRIGVSPHNKNKFIHNSKLTKS